MKKICWLLVALLCLSCMAFAEETECSCENHSDTWEYYGDGLHVQCCLDCGEPVIWESCYEECTNQDGICDVCGSDSPYPYHVGDEFEYVDHGDYHTFCCAACGDGYDESHSVFCTDPDHCAYCGAAWEQEKLYHWYDGTDFGYNEEGHWYLCMDCGIKVSDEVPHVYEDDGNACVVCGKTKQCQHSYWYTYSPFPTCTEEGVKVVKCRYCGEIESTTSVPAKGHTLTTKDMGEYILESCEKCNYENQIPKEEKAVPELVISALTVAEDVNVKVAEGKVIKNVFTVKAAEDADISGKITVTLTLTADELAALENAELVLILEDGNTSAVAYEVLNGQIVFETEVLGTFAFVG